MELMYKVEMDESGQWKCEMQGREEGRKEGRECRDRKREGVERESAK